MVLTSNPHDYVGIEHAPDALIDRVVTFDLEDIPVGTERGIVAARTGLTAEMADRLVQLVRDLRCGNAGSVASIRTALLLGRLVAAQQTKISARDPNFVQICVDVLRSRYVAGGREGFEAALKQALRALPTDDGQEMKVAS